MKWRPSWGPDTLRVEKTKWPKTSGYLRHTWWKSKCYDEIEPINKQCLDFIAASLNEKLNLVKTFDEEIIANCAVEEIEAEIQELDEINSHIMDLL